MPIITAVAAAILLIVQQVLVLGIGKQRRQQKIGVGIGTDPDMERLVRRHGNLAENAPIFLISLGLLELIVGTSVGVLVLAILFLVFRAMHLIAFSSLGGSHGEAGARGYLKVRMVSMLGTMLCGIAAGIYLIIAALMAYAG